MSGEVDALPPLAAEPNAAYMSHYLDHISITRIHLLDDALKFQDSFHSPTGCWTASEKAAFFYALSIYSRLRPDLIAAHIRSKTVVDVVVYLEYLRQASKDTPAPHTSRSKLLIAVEVSDALVAFEEEQAIFLAAAEPELEAQALEGAREQELLTEHDWESERARREEFATWRAAKTQQWQRDDFLAEFDSVKLALLDAVLRGDDLPEEQNDGDAASVSTSAQAHMHTESIAENPSATPVDDTLIDPVLLAESRSESQSVLPSRVTTPPPPYSTPGPSRQPTFSVPRFSISADPLAASPLHADDPQGSTERMSPASRRRFQKRLYMRCKRAGAKGIAVSTEITKMKPGRKAKQRAESTPAPAVEQKDEAKTETVSTSANGGEPQKKPTKRSKTRYEKMKERFEARDIDVDFLQREGLDLFHYGALGRLMRIYAGLNEGREGVETLISGETLRTFAGPRGGDLKSLTKAWRLGEKQVVHSNVAHALLMMGMAHLDKWSQLTTIVPRFGVSVDDDDGEVDAAPQAIEPDYSTTNAQVPIIDAHHQMYAPFVRIPGIELPAPSTSAAEGEVKEDLMSEEDVEDLCAELDEEVALNRVDAQAAEEYEQLLLFDFGLGGQEAMATTTTRQKIPPPPDADETAEVHESGKKRKRRARDENAQDQQHKKGRVAGMYVEPDGIRIKSAVFFDSDEDD
ncbi:hypothetical protein EWM64_g4024 [Hericium alpestre]|uniref:SANT domain-containing protein n=1 Tax=Hericium alpestre TaxID=135208 RepID=A0A4Y9ZZS9_9AGAM|nr:hypothetical protein EWM64_g4024 [Hericium alpestre]